MSLHLDAVKKYYSKTLQSNKDLKTTSCCSSETLPSYLQPIVAAIHPDVRSKFYGCGVPIPLALQGTTVLDLGCGSGRDCFILSKLVGESGQVIGVDMTPEQLNVAQKYLSYHMNEFGFNKSNIDFRHGYIEDLKSIDIADNSVDVVVSNCVFNLSPDKQALYSEIFRVLKPGGELYFSDVFADRRLPGHMSEDPVLLGECLGGAQYIEDFRRMLHQLGCPDYRVTSQTPISITNNEVAKKIGNVNFRSITIRAFKLEIEDRCEDYGQIAYYRGNMPHAPHFFELDDHHRFETNRPLPVCSNTAAMIANTRFSKYFNIVGDTSTHFGLFACSPVTQATETPSSGASCC